jgi:hypothetical protein
MLSPQLDRCIRLDAAIILHERFQGCDWQNLVNRFVIVGSLESSLLVSELEGELILGSQFQENFRYEDENAFG